MITNLPTRAEMRAAEKRLITALFKDGCMGRFCKFISTGPALKNDPTAYVMRGGKQVWIRPGESVDWIEA